MKSTELINQPLHKSFIHYVSLSLFSMLGLSLYILADTFFIANGVGQDGLTALNLVIPVYNVLNGLGLMLGMGGATLYAISQGKNEREESRQIFTSTLIIGTGSGIIFTVLGLLFIDPLLQMLGATGNILPLAKNYFGIILLFSVFFVVNNIVVCFVRNDGNPQLAMTGMLVGSLANIVLDYLFIFPLEMGMEGAALATATSPIISLLILTFHKPFPKRQLAFSTVNWKINPFLSTLSIGFPSFITEFSSGLVIFMFNIVILELSGNVGVAAYGIIANISLVCVAIFTGIGQGIQPIVSVNFGAKKHTNIIHLMTYGFSTALILGILFYGIGLVYSDTITQWFNSENDAVLAAITKKGIALYFMAFLFMGLNIVSIAFFSAVAKPKQSFILSLLRGLILVIPLLFILSSFFGLTGVWLTLPFTEGLTLLLTIYFIRRYFKKANRLLLE
ncbi:putative efflux protein, MATE family [Desemzia incerta]|uniref:Multidrug export protein MepA n=1 Tax=Desemzia incerta TaxID=82801 RepID=A0A1I5VAE3_9LACT|nr:MATE family efflux transporter [Desemzia incerta]SFQ03926.1 putative efflux protein, MATE family [Desemzia incerta]